MTNPNACHKNGLLRIKRQTNDHEQKPKPRNKAIQNQCRPEIQTAEGRTQVGKTRGRLRTKHLRRMKCWLQKLKTVCAAVADERVTCSINRAAHAAFVAGCAGVAETYKVDLKEQSC
jgi:hypothetical protein